MYSLTVEWPEVLKGASIYQATFLNIHELRTTSYLPQRLSITGYTRLLNTDVQNIPNSL